MNGITRIAPAPEPLHLVGARGALAALRYPPAAGIAPRGNVLVIPGFSEEMNRCRSMISLMAREWSFAGLGTLVLDPYATGDSEGEFVQATWAGWREDFLLGVDWLARHAGGCQAVLGVRLGAIMAAEVAHARPQVQRLLWWQPVLSGKSFYTQFLRIRLAAEMSQASRIKTTGELRQLSARGLPVEVSGYEVGPALAAELDAIAFDAQSIAPATDLALFEVQPEGQQAELMPASAAAVKALREKGHAVSTNVVTGPAFWHVHERELAPALIDATAAHCRTWPERSALEATAAPAPVVRAEAAELQGSLERLVTFECESECLTGCLHRAAAATAPRRGVVIVVAGGPQYRAGAHRQFVNLARLFAAQGQPVLRFDLRGMGDSSGTYLGFQHSAPDIRAAVDALLRLEPDLKEVVLVGECESASGILFYAWQDARVAGTVLINPWVRSPEGQAQVIIKSYYLDRIRSREFWAKLFGGQLDLARSLGSFVAVVRSYFQGRRMFKRTRLAGGEDDMSRLPLHEKTAAGLSRFKGPVLLLMSGNDYIAREFDEVTAASAAWTGLLVSPRLVRKVVDGADHTFSRREWKDAAAASITEWTRSW